MVEFQTIWDRFKVIILHIIYYILLYQYNNLLIMQKIDFSYDSIQQASLCSQKQSNIQQCKVTHQQGGAYKICINPDCNFKNPFVCQLCEERHEHNEGQTFTIRVAKMNTLKQNIQKYVSYAKCIYTNYQQLLNIVKQANQIALFCRNSEKTWENIIQSYQNLMKISYQKIQSTNYDRPHTPSIWESLRSFSTESVSEYCNQNQVRLAKKRTQIFANIFQQNPDSSKHLQNQCNESLLSEKNAKIQSKSFGSEQQIRFFDKFYSIFKSVPIIQLPLEQKSLNLQSFRPLQSQIQNLFKTSKQKNQKYALAKLLQLFGMNQKASEVYKKLLFEQPQNIQLLSKRAGILKYTRKYQQAIQQYSSLIEIILKANKRQNIELYYYQRGILYQKIQNYVLAEKDFKKCLFNDKFGAVLKIASLLKLQKKHEQAEQYLLKGLNNTYLSLNQIALIYISLGQIKTIHNKSLQAINYYSQALKIQPKNFTVIIARALLFHQLKKYQQAIRDYTQAIQIKSLTPNLLYNRGIAFLLLKQYDNAAEDFLKVIQIDKQFKPAYVNLANLYLEQQKNTEALYFFEKSSKFYEQNPAIWYNIGKLNLVKYPADQQKALRSINKAIKLNPNYVEAYAARIQIFMQSQNNYKEAQQDLDRLMELNNINASTLHNRGVMRQKQGNLEGALSDFNEVLQRDPKNITSLRARARIYFKTSNNQLYQKDLQRISLLECLQEK